MAKLFTTLLLIISLAIPELHAQADALLGTWMPSNGRSKVKVEKKANGKYYGKIIWLVEPKNADGTDRTDKENATTALKTRKLMGSEILTGFVYDADDKEWADGEIYDPKNGKTYSCVITLTNANSINVRGYVGISWIGRTDAWTKVKE